MYSIKDQSNRAQPMNGIHDIVKKERISSNDYMDTVFVNSRGEEYFFSYEADPGLDLDISLSNIFDAYECFLTDRELSPESSIILRFFVSDITNQKLVLKNYLQHKKISGFVSIIGQQPANGGKIAMMATHIKAKHNNINKSLVHGDLVISHGDYNTYVSKQVPDKAGNCKFQTKIVFCKLENKATSWKATIEKNALRTWVYVRDIDLHYNAMVKKRREIFKSIGLNRDTHYIASTGIESTFTTGSQLIEMDSLLMTGHHPDQIEYMKAPDHMCPTYLYDVTFERGVKILFGDRSHFHISGTASIDHNGDVLHKQSVTRQTQRAFHNIRALMENHGGKLNDIRSMIVYLRDTSDYNRIKPYIEDMVPDASYVMVKGLICRPEWLMEIEAYAVSGNGDKRFSYFC